MQIGGMLQVVTPGTVATKSYDELLVEAYKLDLPT